LSFYQEDPVSINTRLENRRCRFTADCAGRNLQVSGSGILDLEGGGEIVHNGRDQRVLDVILQRATRGAEETVVGIGSKVGVTGEGSAVTVVVIVITIRVKVFFNIDNFRFLVVMKIMSTLVLKGVAESKKGYQ